jgi:hypothetical protein
MKSENKRNLDLKEIEEHLGLIVGETVLLDQSFSIALSRAIALSFADQKVSLVALSSADRLVLRDPMNESESEESLTSSPGFDLRVAGKMLQQDGSPTDLFIVESGSNLGREVEEDQAEVTLVLGDETSGSQSNLRKTEVLSGQFDS